MKDNVAFRVLFLSFLSFLCISISLKAQERRTLSLKEAIDLSLKNSKQLKLSQAKIEEATGAVREAQDRKLPDGSVSASYVRLNSPSVDLKIKSNNSGGGTTPTTTNKAVVNQAAYALVNASLPIYAGGRIRYGIESSKYLLKASELDADHDREAIILNTIDAYNNLFKAKSAVAIVDSSLIEARQRVTDFTNLERNGLLARNDLLKAELQQSNTELSLLDAEYNSRLANVNMNLMLGLPDSTEIAPDSIDFNASKDLKTIPEYIQLAMQNRKDLAALDYRKKAATTGVKATRAEMMPSLAVTGGYIALDIPNALTVYNAVNLGLGVQYNIGSLWKTRAKVQQAEARVKQVVANEEILGDAIRLQINQSYQNYLLSQKRIDVYNTAIAQAEENFHVVQNKFNNGLATVTDVLDADVARLQARLNRAFALSDSYVAYNRLLETTGLLNNSSTQ